MVSDLSVERCTTNEGIAALGPEWNRLFARIPDPSVFLSWEWLYAWWLHFGSGCELRLILVRDGSGTLVGLGPFCVERMRGIWPTRTLKFLGTKRVSSEYLDVLAEPEREREVAAVIVRALREDKRSWDRVELTDLTEGSLVLRLVREMARAANCIARITPGEVCAYRPLPETREAYLSSLTPSTRRDFRRRKKNLEALGAVWTSVDTTEALLPALEALFDLHGRRWSARGLTGNLYETAVREFHRLLARLMGAKGWMRIYTLAHKGKPLAHLYILDHDRRTSIYQTAIDPALPDSRLKANDYSPGFLLFGYCIQDAVDRGSKEVDLLRGSEQYKKRWTTDVRPTHRLTIIPRERWLDCARFEAERVVRSARRAMGEFVRRGQASCVA